MNILFHQNNLNSFSNYTISEVKSFIPALTSNEKRVAAIVAVAMCLIAGLYLMYTAFSAINNRIKKLEKSDLENQAKAAKSTEEAQSEPTNVIQGKAKAMTNVKKDPVLKSTGGNATALDNEWAMVLDAVEKAESENTKTHSKDAKPFTQPKVAKPKSGGANSVSNFNKKSEKSFKIFDATEFDQNSALDQVKHIHENANELSFFPEYGKDKVKEYLEKIYYGNTNFHASLAVRNGEIIGCCIGEVEENPNKKGDFYFNIHHLIVKNSVTDGLMVEEDLMLQALIKTKQQLKLNKLHVSYDSGGDEFGKLALCKSFAKYQIDVKDGDSHEEYHKTLWVAFDLTKFNP